jgi:hypothetical protein
MYQDFDTLVSNDTECEFSKKNSNLPFSNPHSSALMDIDGDCFNDLIIFSVNPSTNKKQMEIWKGWVKNSIAYCLSEINTYQLDNRIGLVSFADIDRDGFVDIVFPVDEFPTPTISVLFNQIKVNIDWTYDYCKERKPDSLTIEQVFPSKVLSKGGDNLGSQIFISLMPDSNKVFYSDTDLKLRPLVRVGKFYF